MSDNKHSAEWNSLSDPSVAVMGKAVLLKLQTLPERSESVLRHTVYCTGDYYSVAAPCTKIITVSAKSWTPAIL